MSDIEKQLSQIPQPASKSEVITGYTEEIKTYDSRIWKFVRFLHAEETGVERIPDDLRTNHSEYSIGILFTAINMVYLGISIGVNGITAYGLTFWDSVLCIIFFNIIGFLPVAYMCTFGPTFGMRQMVVSRFWVGYQTMRLFAAINSCICIGWAVLNLVAGANLLHTLGHGALPPWAAIIIMTVGTLFVTALGYKAIHLFERWAWIPTFLVTFVIIARVKISGSFSPGYMSAGRAEAGAVLSYGAALFGNASGWTLFACDYTAYMKTTTSKLKLSCSVMFGCLFTTMFLQLVGVSAAACLNSNPVYKKMYDEFGAGGLFYAILVEDSLGRFGQFCIVLLALTLTTCNIACVYSSSLSAQAVCSRFRLLPRFYWVLLANAVALGVSIPCYYRFTEVLDDFMSLLSYFISLYIGIVLSEHFLYRRQRGYVPDTYMAPEKLPVSYAALFAFCCGVAGAVIGMSEAWWTGPLAKAISEDVPGDIGFQLSFAFAFIGHASTRWAELKYIGR
ncbi:hypothetical protein DTO164E3_8513 [Paecilomyces variotii]|nr:hypothetical protein DTO164E3_8513 [Paecilomyces variotii]KAJ9395028.1 hypothetical protein DTO282F9_8016 [Paecilomyces variotii]KAJ9407983.1 hypothetical protein DTO045G8_4161 [Paecilomyces variotii]